jgi:hypothetical protein
MGTTYCALFIFMTQDIVPAVVKDTPLKRLCQMLTAPGLICSITDLFIVFHAVIAHQLCLEGSLLFTGDSEMRLNAGFRFVANVPINVSGLMK